MAIQWSYFTECMPDISGTAFHGSDVAFETRHLFRSCYSLFYLFLCIFLSKNCLFQVRATTRKSPYWRWSGATRGTQPPAGIWVSNYFC